VSFVTLFSAKIIIFPCDYRLKFVQIDIRHPPHGQPKLTPRSSKKKSFPEILTCGSRRLLIVAELSESSVLVAL